MTRRLPVGVTLAEGMALPKSSSFVCGHLKQFVLNEPLFLNACPDFFKHC